MKQDIEVASRIEREKVTQELHEFAVPLFKAGAEWRINSVWHSITVIPNCHRFIVFLPKKSTIGSKNPIMGILEENRTFISSRPGCILCRLDEMESKFLIGSYEQFWIINGSVCPAITGEAGYSKEEFDKVNKENKDPELESINSFNDTVKKANEIKDRVLKYVYNIKQERSYNNDLIGIFERYKDIADGDMEVAMNFIKEAYPFNEETESFIRKKFDMPIPDESKEQ